MITGGGNTSVKKQEITVGVGGESSFELLNPLTEDTLVFIGGMLTDIVYTGFGTNTIVFSQIILQGEVITIK